MQAETNVAETEQHLFTPDDLFQHQDATSGQRCLNYVIDNVLMRFGLSYVTGSLVGFILGILAPDYIQKLAYEPSNFDLIVLGVLIAYFNYIVYYTFCEKLFRGYTLGKLITGTRAIRSDGQELSFKDALLRSLCRIVPFEVFSGFSYPWHDRWTNTTVIKSR